MSEEEYGKAFKRECERYLATAKELDAEPLPPTKGRSRDERLSDLAKRMRQDTEKLERLAADYRRLKPPLSCKGLHSAYQEFLDGQVRINNAYAAALEARNRDEARKKNQEYVDFVGTQMGRVLDEMEKGGVSVSELRANLKGVIEENQ